MNPSRTRRFISDLDSLPFDEVAVQELREDLDLIDAINLARNVGEGIGKSPLFVETGNLDDELHDISLHWLRSRAYPQLSCLS